MSLVHVKTQYFKRLSMLKQRLLFLILPRQIQKEKRQEFKDISRENTTNVNGCTVGTNAEYPKLQSSS